MNFLRFAGLLAGCALAVTIVQVMDVTAIYVRFSAVFTLGMLGMLVGDAVYDLIS